MRRSRGRGPFAEWEWIPGRSSPISANLAKISGRDYAAWRSLRDRTSQVRRVAVPRFLSLDGVGAKTKPGRGVDFEEQTAGVAGWRFRSYAWAN